jgi:hypothetical protein
MNIKIKNTLELIRKKSVKIEPKKEDLSYLAQITRSKFKKKLQPTTRNNVVKVNLKMDLVSQMVEKTMKKQPKANPTFFRKMYEELS